MPASSGPIPVSTANNIWHQHEAQIKDLYQNQRKTLREVKQIMEETGFPKAPLSTWESKLREELQLRKKAKSHNWPLIYQHVLPRLECPGKKKLKKQTIIRLNGSKIPWDKAWKEIRRSGALAVDQHSTNQNPLPPDVTIRSPSPGPTYSPRTPPAALPVVPVASTRCTNTTSAALVPLQTSVGAPPLQARSLTYSFSVFLSQWCASSIPWLDVCQSLQHVFRDAKQTRQLELLFSSFLNEFLATSATARAVRSQTRNEINSSEGRLDLLRDDRLLPPRPSPDLGYRVAKSGGQVELSHFMSTAIFLLSNHLHDSEDGDQGLQLLCSLLDRNEFLTTTLLRSQSPSIRAAWEALFTFSMFKKRKHTLRSLTEIGIHNCWLNPLQAGDYLRGIIEMDCYDIVPKLVANFNASNCSHWWRYSLHAILLACQKGNVKCVRLLLHHCNVNAKKVRSRQDRSMFQDLVANLENSNDEYALAMDLFLADGADVDQHSDRKRITHKWRRLVGRNKLLRPTRPTILDEIFYTNHSMFNKARPYSRVQASTVSRTGLLAALADGLQTLREYLSARQPGNLAFDSAHVQSLLELLLAEQFEISKIVDMRIVRVLFEFGVDFAVPSVALNILEYWRSDVFDGKWNNSVVEPFRRTYKAEYLHFDWRQFDNMADIMQLLNTLLEQGGVIGEHVLEGFVAEYGTGGLECLALRLKDFSAKAVRALVRAARLNNFEDVEFLLRKGVDPNSFILISGKKYSIQAAATHASFLKPRGELPDRGCSLEMIQFLARHGARLLVTPEDSTPFDFANHLLREASQIGLLAKIKYVLGTVMEEMPFSRLPSFLLESCFRRRNTFNSYYWSDENFNQRSKFYVVEYLNRLQLELFEYLFRRGTEVSPGSPLAALVLADGREELVRDVLYSGSDLSAYWANQNGDEFTPLQVAALKGNEDLVCRLLQEGANVNSPARHDDGVTALEAICGWHPATEEEHQRKMRICILLIQKGADINSAFPERGCTILGAAALTGDLELAALLLREGADVNAKSRTGTPLDQAAESGRLDVVQFLLRANALSAVRGASGYDGAIYRAVRYHHSAVAELIREYASKVEAGTLFNPELLRPQEGSRLYSLGSDDDSSDDESASSLSDSAEDGDVAGGTHGMTVTRLLQDGGASCTP